MTNIFRTDRHSDFLVIATGKILQGLIVLISLRVMTAILSPEELGSYFIFFSVTTFFALTLINPIGQYINRKTHSWRDKKSIFYNLKRYNLYLIAISILSLPVCLQLKYHNIIFGASENSASVWILPIYLLTSTWTNTIIPMMNMLGYRRHFTALTLLTALMLLLLPLIFVYAFEKSFQYWIFGLTFSYFLMACLSFSVFRGLEATPEPSNRQPYLSFEALREVAKYSSPIAVMTIFLWFHTSGYRLLIEKELGLEYLGYLGIGMTIAAQISSLFETILMQYFYPAFYNGINTDNKVERTISINKLINALLPVYLFLTIFVSCFSDEILDVLVDTKYGTISHIVIFAAWYEFFRMTTSVISNIAHSEMKTPRLIMPYFVGAFFTLIGSTFALKLDHNQIIFPIVLAISMGAAAFAMSKSMRTLIRFHIDFNRVIFVLISSSPIIIWGIFGSGPSSILESILILATYGGYFLLMLYILSTTWRYRT